MAYTITITATGGSISSTVFAGMLDFTGATFTAVDVSSSRNSGATLDATPFTTSITTTQTGDVMVGMMTVGTGTQALSASPTSNPTMSLGNNIDGNSYIDDYGIWTSSGAKAIGFTNASQTYQLARIVAAFKATGTATFNQKARLSGTLTSGSLTTTVTQPTNGDLVIVGVAFAFVNTNPTTRTVTDSFNNTFTELLNVYNSNGFISLSLFYCLNFQSVQVPTVTTQAATFVGAYGATGNGNITSLGNEPSCSAEGFVYDTSSHSLPGNVAPGSSGYAHFVSQSGTFGTGAFTENITGLTQNTTYYYRAWAQNAVGYAYGTEVSFLSAIPVILKFAGFVW